MTEDRPDLQRLENIVRLHSTIGTAALALESGISPKRICQLFTDYLSSVSRNPHPVGPSFDVWSYMPTVAGTPA